MPLATGVEEVYVSSNLAWKQPHKALLGEMAIIRENRTDFLASHDVHGNAVDQTVLLVRASLVECQSCKKRLVRLLDHFNAGICENLPDKLARHNAGLVAVSGDCG